MNFCSQCAGELILKIPPGDNLYRHVCEKCGTIHYQNPKIVAGCIVEWRHKILLCRRAIEPRLGYWTLPAGFMENNETTQDAAARESWEEAQARLKDLRFFGLFNLPHISQVYMMFHAGLVDGKAAAGEESSEVSLFDEQEIPWDELAFPVIHESLELFFDDRRHDRVQVHMGDIIRDAESNLQIKRY